MPVYLCRWPNGDVSFVHAKNKGDAIFILDEVGSADNSMLVRIDDFFVHYRLSKGGKFAHDQFGASTYDVLMKETDLHSR